MTDLLITSEPRLYLDLVKIIWEYTGEEQKIFDQWDENKYISGSLSEMIIKDWQLNVCKKCLIKIDRKCTTCYHFIKCNKNEICSEWEPCKT